MSNPSQFHFYAASLLIFGVNIQGLLAQHIRPDENGRENETDEIGCPVDGLSNERFQVAHFDFENVRTHLIVSLWILFVSVAKIAFHSSKKLSKLFPESCLLIVVGVILGVILYFADASDNHQLDTRTFFLIILPPIIIDAGYFMPSRAFFDQFGTILLFAVFGTLINTFMIGFSLWAVGLTGIYGPSVCLPLLHALVFASLLAAVDPVAVLAVFESIHVNKVLYIVVFGEALLNDGISVVLYHLFEGFTLIGADNIQAVDIVAGIGSFFVIVIGAPAIGILLGFLGGWISRFTHHVRIMEPLIVLVICYMSFIIPEMFHLSGILGCTFCGITMRKYVEANISEKSQTTIKYAMKMMASAAEAIIFMYLGVAAVSDERVWNTAFILLTLLFCLVYRTIGVILQAFLANFIRLKKLSPGDQFLMSFGGLRGAIAFALSALLEKEVYKSRELFITTTIVVVYFTNLILGTLVEPLVKLLKIKREGQSLPSMNEKIANRMLDHLMIAVEGIAEQRGHNLIREKFSQFNNRVLKPCVIGRKPHAKQNIRGRGSEIFRVYRQLSAKDARFISRNPNSAASLHRWRSTISGNLDLFGSTSRNQSMYELPDYWRGSAANVSDRETKTPAGVYNGIYATPASASLELNDVKFCSCNCHSMSNDSLASGHQPASQSERFNSQSAAKPESTDYRRLASRERRGDFEQSVAVTFNANSFRSKATSSSREDQNMGYDDYEGQRFEHSSSTSDDNSSQSSAQDVVYRF